MKLRLGLIAAAIVLTIWAILADNPWAIAWNAAFAIVNIAQAARLARANSVQLSEEEAWVHREVFPTLTNRDFLQLWASGQGVEQPRGTALITEGTQQDDLILVLDGDVQITNSSGLDQTRGPLTFLGEMSFFSGQPASADATVASTVRYRRWDQEGLRNLTKLSSECAGALRDALGKDIALKLGT